MPDQLGRFLPGEHWRPPQLFRERDWLEQEYVQKQRSTGEIAKEFGVTDAAILFWIRRHGIPRRSVSEARKIKHWGSAGETNPMYGRRGADAPQWKGGTTPERQLFYSTAQWKAAAKLVKRRDADRCRMCWAAGSHIHHIAPFRHVELRAEPNNLVLLCPDCHRFVHSPRNTDRLFRLVGKGGDSNGG